jgi:hypothetical protein
MLIFGGWLLTLRITILIRHCVYLEYPYLATGVAFVLIGIISLLCVLYGARSRGYWGILFLVPVVIGLWTMIVIPNIFPFDLEGSAHLSHVAGALDFFSKLHSRYPGDETELEQVLAALPKEPSLYRKNGQELPFRIVLIANATGPFLESPGSDPGIMFYAVSPDRQEAWLTATELRHPVGNQVRFSDFFSVDGDHRVFHRRISQPQSQ